MEQAVLSLFVGQDGLIGLIVSNQVPNKGLRALEGLIALPGVVSRFQHFLVRSRAFRFFFLVLAASGDLLWKRSSRSLSDYPLRFFRLQQVLKKQYTPLVASLPSTSGQGLLELGSGKCIAEWIRSRGARDL